MPLDLDRQSRCGRHEFSDIQHWYVKRPHRAESWRTPRMTKVAPWCKQHDGTEDDPSDWLPLRAALEHITRAVESSHRILDMVDEDGNALCSRAAWERAANFLNNYARRLWANQGVKIETPDIMPGPDDSVDIHWDGRTYEMLMNVPADPNTPIKFYGDDRRGNSVKGTVTSADNGGLLLWLATASTK